MDSIKVLGKKYYTLMGASKVLGMKYLFLYERVQKKEIKTYRPSKNKGKYYISEMELQKFVERSTK